MNSSLSTPDLIAKMNAKIDGLQPLGEGKENIPAVMASGYLLAMHDAGIVSDEEWHGYNHAIDLKAGVYVDGQKENSNGTQPPKWYLPLVEYFLYRVVLIALLSITFVFFIDWVLSVAAAATLYTIVQPTLRTIRNSSEFGKPFKELTVAERWGLVERLVSISIAVFAFWVGCNAAGL